MDWRDQGRAVGKAMEQLAALFKPSRAKKPPQKEKWVSILEILLQQGGQPPGYEACELKDIFDRQWEGGRFWEELLLLKVNQQWLESWLEGCDEATLVARGPVLSEVAAVCIHFFHDHNLLRVSHACETIAILVKHTLRRRGLGTLTLLKLLAGGEEHAGAFFHRMITATSAVVTNSSYPTPLRYLASTIILNILTATNNINQNALTGYLMIDEIYSTLTELIVEGESGGVHKVLPKRRSKEDALLRRSAMVALVLLLGWRESKNAYLNRFLATGAEDTYNLLLALGWGLQGPQQEGTGPGATDALGKEGLPLEYLGTWHGYIGEASIWEDIITDIAGGPQPGADEASPLITWRSSYLPLSVLLLLHYHLSQHPLLHSAAAWIRAAPASSIQTASTSASAASRSPPKGEPSAAVQTGVQLMLAMQWGVVLGRVVCYAGVVFGLAPLAESVEMTPALAAAAVLRSLTEPDQTLRYLLRTDLTALAGPTAIPSATHRPAVLAIAEVLVGLLQAGGGGGDAADASCPARDRPWEGSGQGVVLEMTAVYVLHRMLHFCTTSGTTVHFDWAAMWRALLACLARLASPKAFQAPRVPILASQVVNLLNLCLERGDVLLSSPEDAAGLHVAVVEERGMLADLARVAAAAAPPPPSKAPLPGLRLRNLEAVQVHYGGVAAARLPAAVAQKMGSLQLAGLDRLDPNFAVGTKAYVADMIDKAAMGAVERGIVRDYRRSHTRVPKAVEVSIPDPDTIQF